MTFHTRVRPSGSGKADADPIAGVRNTIAVASGKGRWQVDGGGEPGRGAEQAGAKSDCSTPTSTAPASR